MNDIKKSTYKILIAMNSHREHANKKCAQQTPHSHPSIYIYPLSLP